MEKYKIANTAKYLIATKLYKAIKYTEIVNTPKINTVDISHPKSKRL